MSVLPVFSAAPITDAELKTALSRCIAQLQLNLPLYARRCQNHSSVNGVYPACANDQWTCGFWPGQLWLAYEHTGEETFRQAGLALAGSFARRIRNKVKVAHHDMGFLYSPACVAAWQLAGDETARTAALQAAEQMTTRFVQPGGYFQAWGRMGVHANKRFIIDCLMNLPLLYWASRECGDARYAKLARRHTETCLKYSYRPDGSTWHTFFMAPDGSPLRGETCQGYKNDSFWARGQAWGVYGGILAWRETQSEEALEAFRKATGFFASRLPQDLVPCWDMIFTPESGEERDSSAAAIAACGLLEAARLLGGGEGEAYRLLAKQILGSLARNYQPQTPAPGAGQLLHGTYSKKSPYNTCTPEGEDEFTSFGDYFYMEALTRLAADWKTYW